MNTQANKEVQEPKDMVVVAHDQRESPIYGHDSNTKIHFNDEGALQLFFQSDLFKVHKGHYIRDGQLHFARLIICAWKGKAYCQLNMDRRLLPSDEEKPAKIQKRSRQEYQVQSTDWFETPVDLTAMGIRNLNNMPSISHQLHKKILDKAGNLERFK